MMTNTGDWTWTPVTGRLFTCPGCLCAVADSARDAHRARCERSTAEAYPVSTDTDAARWVQREA